MLALGRGAVGTVGGRLRWAQVDLESPDWRNVLDAARVDAVLSSTAMRETRVRVIASSKPPLGDVISTAYPLSFR